MLACAMKRKKPAALKINLLPKDPFFETVVGKTLKWALSAGRYIVIFTEIIVIVSFLARFTLDRQLTNVNGEIADNEAIIQSYGDLEQNFRSVQEKTKQIEEINKDKNLVDIFAYISEVTPVGIEVSELRILKEEISLAGTTTSQNNLNLLINNLQLSAHFSDIRIDEISNREENLPGYEFSLKAKTGQGVRVVGGS